MRLAEQVAQAQKIRDFLMTEAPQDQDGNLLPSYNGWLRQLDHWIGKGKRWLGENRGSPK